MFKPVSGADLEAYDPETRELFRRRFHDPRLTVALMKIPRRARNHLPIYVDKEN